MISKGILRDTIQGSNISREKENHPKVPCVGDMLVARRVSIRRGMKLFHLLNASPVRRKRCDNLRGAPTLPVFHQKEIAGLYCRK